MPGSLELQSEVQHGFVVYVDDAEVELWCDETDFVVNPLCRGGGLEVVECACDRASSAGMSMTIRVLSETEIAVGRRRIVSERPAIVNRPGSAEYGWRWAGGPWR